MLLWAGSCFFASALETHPGQYAAGSGYRRCDGLCTVSAVVCLSLCTAACNGQWLLCHCCVACCHGRWRFFGCSAGVVLVLGGGGVLTSATGGICIPAWWSSSALVVCVHGQAGANAPATGCYALGEPPGHFVLTSGHVIRFLRARVTTLATASSIFA